MLEFNFACCCQQKALEMKRENNWERGCNSLKILHQNAKSIIGQRKEIKPLLLDLIKAVVRCSISFNIVSVMLMPSPTYLHDNE